MSPEPAARVLLVDDDDALREVLQFQLEDAGYAVTACAGGAAAVAALEGEPPDLILTDLKMPGVGGREVLRAARRAAPQVPVLVVTAFGSVASAVEALRAGAYDYVTKPFPREALLLKLDRALQYARLRSENDRLRQGAERSAGRPLLVVSRAMERLMDAAARVAPSDLPVLLAGESGTGKELVAREVHRLSHRAAGPFVAVNCAAIPKELLEAELFGHEKGAFTGAAIRREGRFRAASGGTLLLDEVGDLPLELQPKLLRVLQEGAVEPVGGRGPVPVDVRVVAATHRDLPQRVREGAFREDLYYRLAVVPLRVPPLRDRREAIGPLFEVFLRSQGGGRRLDLTPEALVALQRRPWPGNVRQLENLARRVALLAPGPTLTPGDLPPDEALGEVPSGGELVVDIATTPYGVELPTAPLSLPAVEQALIDAALALHGGNKSAAARHLGVPRHVLLYRLEKRGE